MKYKAETWDLMQRNFENFNDHCLHGIIHLSNSLNIDSLQKAIDDICPIVPLLTCKFVISANRKKSWWEKAGPFSVHDILTITDSEAANQEDDPAQETFITQKIDECKGPQIAIRLFRYKNGSCSLCIILNHMICDAAGFRQLLYLFCEKYNQSITASVDSADLKYVQKRKASQVWKELTLKNFSTFLTGPTMASSPDPSLCISFKSSKDQTRPHMILKTIDRAQLTSVKEYAHSHSYTINDIILAALCQTIQKEINPNPSVPLIIPCPFDQRRYRTHKDDIGICNLVSIVWCNFGNNVGKDISETLPIVKETMDKIKDQYPGLKGFFLLDLLFRLLSFRSIENKIKHQFPNPLLGMTNVGIIDSKKLSFSGTEVTNVIINGSMKYPPYFQIAFSTFKDQLTLSINQYCGDCDLPSLNRFLSVFTSEFANLL